MPSTKVSITPHKSETYNKVASESKMIYPQPFAVFNPSNCVLPDFYKHDVEKILNFEVREDDVWVVSYPKCGTTWTQEMVWLLIHDLDYEKGKQADIMQRFPYIEFSSLQVPEENSPCWIDVLNEESSPRCIKSHLPKDLLPQQIWKKEVKIIYVARNPKDVLLSYFHQHRSWMVYSGSLETFADAFLDDALLYGSYWEHVLDIWAIKEPNVLFNTYEEMKKDLPGVIRKTAKFLKKNLTDEQVSKLGEHLSFNKMKENASVNYRDFFAPVHKQYNIKNEFMRKGESGAWKKDMSPEMVSRVDEWSKKKLGNSDFPFYR